MQDITDEQAIRISILPLRGEWDEWISVKDRTPTISILPLRGELDESRHR